MLFTISIILIWIAIIVTNAVTIINLKYKKDLSRSKEEVKVLKETINLYEENEDDLKTCIEYYENGMHQTLEENIILKKKLNEMGEIS